MSTAFNVNLWTLCFVIQKVPKPFKGVGNCLLARQPIVPSLSEMKVVMDLECFTHLQMQAMDDGETKTGTRCFIDVNISYQDSIYTSSKPPAVIRSSTLTH